MGWWDELRYLARRLDRRRAEKELDEEVRAHLELEIEANVEAGMSPDEARFAALRRFGNVGLAKEDTRAMWGLRSLETLWQDLRYGLRVLRTSPGYTAAAVVSLALGIGACTAMFSVVDAVLLRSLPYPEPDLIVEVRELSERGSQMPVTEPNFLDLRARSRSFDALAEYATDTVTVTGGVQPVRTRVAVGSGDLFRVLGVEPAVGRTFLPEERVPGATPVAVVSYGFWQRLLGGSPDLTGSAVKVEDQSYTVVGVMPAGFDYPERTDVWLPREGFPPDTSRTAHNWSAIGRLRSGVRFDQARADVSSVGRELKREYGGGTDAADMAVVPLQEYIVGDVRYALFLLLGAVGLLLLIACANVANLMLAQATARQKELAVRAALGATRARLVRQFITESLVLVLLGAAAGVGLSILGVGFFIDLSRAGLPRVNEIGVDGRALLFTVGVSALVAVALGLATALRGSRPDVHAEVKEAGRDQTAGVARSRLRKALVVSQVALTFVLLVGAGLLAKSFVRLLEVNPGFRVESAVAMDVSVASPNDDEQEGRTRRFYEQLLARFEALPGASAVGGVSALPMTGFGGNGTFLVDNDPANTGYAEYRVASGGYFAAMGIPLLRGRLFGPGDTPDSPHVALVSQSLASKYWPGEDPVGKRIQFGNMDGDERLLNVVGVVGDVRGRSLDAAVSPTVYAYYLQRPQRSGFSVVVRSETDPAALVPAMRAELRALDPELPAEFRTLDEIFSSSLDGRRFSVELFGAFATVALLLAVTGIYGVTAYAVAQRTHEIGIRMALGARPQTVLAMVIGQGAALALVGVAIGAAAASAAARLLASSLYSVSATDPATFALVALVLAGVALLACYIPARRAMRVDPIITLRCE